MVINLKTAKALGLTIPSSLPAAGGSRDRIAMLVAEHRRRALLTAALSFLQFLAQTPALRARHAWLDNGRGLGIIVDGIARQGYPVSVR